jgi:hypothetical protein
MAGLITEALAREEEINWKKSLASERAVMLQALEQLKPNLAALVEKPAAVPTSPASSAGTYLCPKCGHKLLGEEQFCGECGTPRSGKSEEEVPSMQSKVATLWHMQEAQQKEATSESADSKLSPKDAKHDSNRPALEVMADSLEEEMPDFFMAPDLPAEKIGDLLESSRVPQADATPLSAGASDNHAEPDEEVEGAASQELALAKPAAADWSSAHAARAFFEELAGMNRPGALARFWNSHRGDFYLAIALILVGCAIRWGIWSDHAVATAAPNTAAAAHRKPADADLPLFDRMLISLGLAEAPPAPEDQGNPSTQVWVDLHTALYYCPGADLYGKTPTGKYTSQREAQLDQFEPAYRKTCN